MLLNDRSDKRFHVQNRSRQDPRQAVGPRATRLLFGRRTCTSINLDGVRFCGRRVYHVTSTDHARPADSNEVAAAWRAQTARRRRQRSSPRIVISVLVVLVVFVASYAGVGYQLFYRDHSDSLRKVNVIVVLGGEHDGREDYGLKLAHEGYAKTVLISDPYVNDGYNREGQALMHRVCSSSTAEVEVICFDPDPSTTRGEAMFTQRMAKARHWHSAIVISWRFHLVRARYIFGQCFDGDVVMRGMDKPYPTSPAFWAWQFSYQYVGLAKAAVLGCEK